MMDASIMKEPVKSDKNLGDLVNGITYAIFLPVYGYLAFIEEENEGAFYITAMFAWTVAFSWPSYWLSNGWFFSLMAFCGLCGSYGAMNMYEWPHKGEIVVLPQFFWTLMIASANQNLGFWVKAMMGLITFGTALMVTIWSPLADIAETTPYLLGSLAVYILFHYYSAAENIPDGKPKGMSARMALLILAGTFAHHAATELVAILSSSGYALTGGFSILKAGFFAAAGMAAAGSFRREIDLNESLSTLVEERAKEIAKQSLKLQMIGLAMEKSETAIGILDSNKNVLWANPALGKLAGPGPVQLEQERIFQALHMTLEDRSKLKKCFDTAAEEEDLCIRDRIYRVEVSPCPDLSDLARNTSKASGPRFVVALKDITETRTRENVEKLVEEERLLARALTESMEMLSHELRTPLQGIMGMTSLLLADSSDLPAESKEPLSLIMASSRLLLTLINNMLDIRKCDANMMDNFELSDLQVGPPIREAVDFCRPIGGIAGVNLVSLLESTVKIMVQVNPVRLQQMIINLVSNAIKYSPKQGTVTIATKLMTLEEVEAEIDASIEYAPKQRKQFSMEERKRNMVVRVSVADEGNGIGEGGKLEIFEKFSQLKSKQENSIGNVHVGQPSGTGLGLNLCVKFAARMNGAIWVANNPDKGSCFCFYLPVVSTLERVPAMQSSGRSESFVLEDNARLQSCRILICDDTIINLKVLRRMLERIGISANNVTTVESGEAALEELDLSHKSSNYYDIVITDIQMPGIDGFEVSRLINEKPRLMRNQPFVVGLTAETSETLHKRARDNGMHSILFKPITATQMKHFLESNLDLKLQ